MRIYKRLTRKKFSRRGWSYRFPYDASLKKFFSYKTMVKSFIKTFISLKVVNSINFSTLTRYPNNFITRDLRERRSDIIWKVQCQNGEWLYLFIMFEFQSTVEPFMALRIAEYESLLLHDLVRSHTIAAKDNLPPILPIVIYNGDATWHAPCELSKLYGRIPESLENLQLNASFILMDIHDIPESSIQNNQEIASILMRLERIRELKDLQVIVEDLASLKWNTPENIDLMETFNAYITAILQKTEIGEKNLNEIHMIGDLKSMLETNLINWRNRVREEGKAEGLIEGKAEGLIEGKAEGLIEGKAEGLIEGKVAGEIAGALGILISILKMKFGELPEDLTSRLATISDPNLIQSLVQPVIEVKTLQTFMGIFNQTISINVKN